MNMATSDPTSNMDDSMNVVPGEGPDETAGQSTYDFDINGDHLQIIGEGAILPMWDKIKSAVMNIFPTAKLQETGANTQPEAAPGNTGTPMTGLKAMMRSTYGQ